MIQLRRRGIYIHIQTQTHTQKQWNITQPQKRNTTISSDMNERKDYYAQ